MRSGRAAAPSRSEGYTATMKLGYADIIQRLPHRYPFLLVDRVIEFVDGKQLVAVKSVTANEPFFTGHFPGHPIMPGVLICEALVQAGGLLASCSTGGLPPGRGVVLTGLERVRFRRQVVPGDQLRLEIDLVHQRRPLWKMKGVARVDGQIAAEAEFLTMEIDSSAIGR
jgi:3-hydroxyacyl-[acyl-carrier-protein] dehydratase